RTGNNRGVVAREVVGRQQLTQLHFYQLQHFVVFFSAYAAAVFCQQVSLVQEHHDKRYTYLTRQQNVLAGLWHGAIGGTTDQNRTVHLRGTGNHVFHIIGVAWAVYVGVVTFR